MAKNEATALRPGRQRPSLTDVVVIDDDESMCEACLQTLESSGYRTRVASNGQLGLRMIADAHPSVVLVDLKMPGMDGIQVLEEIPRVDPGVIPIVITGYGTIDAAVESTRLGASDFITKPFEPEKLLESVGRGIRLRQVQGQAPPVKEEAPPQEAPALPKVEKEDVLLRGFAVLADFYALGFDKVQYLDELRYLDAEARYHAASLGQVKKQRNALLELVQQLQQVDAIVRNYDFQKNALIQILLDIQAQFHWLPRYALKWIAARLHVPLANIYRIASFYEAFSLEPQGAHLVQVCTGTACHVRGAPELLARTTLILGLQPNQTDAEQRFTLKTVRCMGCCALAPVVRVDDEYYSNPSVNRLKSIVDSVAKEEGQ